MSRASARWGLGLGVIASAAGCTSILGNFTVGDNGTTGGGEGGTTVDGSPIDHDGSAGDDASAPHDATVDGTSSSDAASDTTQPDAGPITLNCVEQTGIARTKLATIATSTNNDGQMVRLFNTSVGAQTAYRAIVPEQGATTATVYHVYSFSSGGNGATTDDAIPLPTGGGQVLSVVRYATGIGALIFATQDQGSTSSPILEVVRLEDGDNVWTSPVIVTALAPSTCFNRVVGALDIVSAVNQDYIFELAYQPCTASQTTHVAGRSTGGAVTNPGFWPLPSDAVEGADAAAMGSPADAGPVMFDIAGILTSGTGLYSLTNPSGGNGPLQGVGSSIFTSTLSMSSGASPRELPLTNDSDIMEGLALASLTTGNVGVAILEANLASSTVTPVIYAGNVPAATLSTLVPATDLHAVTFASLADVPVNNASVHWESFAAPNASDNLLAVGSVFPANDGLNFVWLTADGTVRGKRTGQQSFFFNANTSAAIYAGDVTFSSAPFAAIAGFELVFVQTSGDAGGHNDVWATQVNCAAP